MALTIGITGLPNVGESTTLNTLARINVLATNYPFTTIEPNVGAVPPPDERLGVLVKIFNSQKIVPTTVSFVDIAGIVKSASKGEGLGNRFLTNVREADAICQMTRAFTGPGVAHVEDKIDPASDIGTISTKLILTGLQTLEKTIPRLRKKVSGEKAPKEMLAAAEQCEKILNSGCTLSSAITVEELDGGLTREFQLMTSKPSVYVLNMDAEGLADQAKREELTALVAPTEAVFLNGAFKAELVELDEADVHEMLADAELQGSSLGQLARVGFATLGLQTSLAAGGRESRAWTIHQGWTAPQAAGAIHTDLERGFIKADIIGYDDLVRIGDLHKARELGKIRQGGKNYVVRDGDVVELKFNA